MQPLSEDRFAELAEIAYEELRDELDWFEDLQAHLENVAVVIEDENAEEPDILGLYEGVAQVDRGWDYAGALPDKVSIYRLPLCRLVADEDELIDEIQVTIVHELAHHLGIDDERLHELGWA